MSSSNAPVYADNVVNQVTGAISLAQLSHTLKNGISKDAREALLISFLSNGQDPLAVLDVRAHTLGVLYILSARVNASFGSTPPPSWQIVEDFCQHFDPDQARFAPDRITKLGKGIHRLAGHLSNPSLAIPPLQNLLTRYPPDSSYLTTIHPIFLLACVSTGNFNAARSVLRNPITDVDTIEVSPDLTYNDNLIYHYLGGIALAALKRWKDAEEYFEICVTSPGSAPAALQMEALKKLRLVQLISTGQVSNLPKYTNTQLTRLFKNTPYWSFITAYPNNTQHLRDIYEKEKNLFAQDRNIGLIQQAINRASRWALKKLTATYVTLHVSDIGKAVKIDSEDEVRALLLSMIESNDICAEISASGSVTFSDPPPQFTKEQLDSVLGDIQQQTELLSMLEQEMGRSKEFLNKVVKSGESWSANAPDEELLSGITSSQALWEDN